MLILRRKKFYFTFMSDLLSAGYIFQSRHLQAYYKHGLSIVWRGHVPTCNRYVLKCGRSHSDLFHKIDTPKKRDKILEQYFETSYFSVNLQATCLTKAELQHRLFPVVSKIILFVHNFFRYTTESFCCMKMML